MYPDDWHGFYRQCERCGSRWHASEGECSTCAAQHGELCREAVDAMASLDEASLSYLPAEEVARLLDAVQRAADWTAEARAERAP